MAGAATAIEQLPNVLWWSVEWLGAPATMLWLWLRWILWGPVPDKPGVRLSLGQRAAARQATAAGTALGALLFLIFWTAVHPVPPSVTLPTDKTPGAFLPDFGSVLVLAGGVAVGLLPRPVRHWGITHPSLAWVCQLEVATLLSSTVAVFSLLSYFEWREAHQWLLPGLAGLATGYQFSP